MLRKTRRIIAACTFLIGVVLALVFVVPIFHPWTELNCRHQDVDIKTGRLRFQRYLLFCKVSERIEESSLSRVLPPSVLADTKPEWQRVNTFSPGTLNSPHYIFHGAISQIHDLKLWWDVAEVPDSIRQKTALHVLAIWQYAGDYFLADRYIYALADLDDRSKRDALIESIQKLQMPQEEVKGSVIIRTVFYPNGQPMDRVQGYRGADGQFVRNGFWESWYPGGKRSDYGHFRDDIPLDSQADF
jgi:hypothetical protein